MKVQIILIHDFQDIFNETFQTLIEFDFSVFDKYDKYLKSKFYTSYNLSFKDYLLWEMYLKKIDINAEILCDNKTIKDRYEYFTTRKNIINFSILNYFIDENNFKFNFNGKDYYVPAINVRNRDSYIKEYDASNLYTYSSNLRFWYRNNYKFKIPTMIIKVV